MRRWDDATYADDLSDPDGPQVCADCGIDCEPDDYDECGWIFLCTHCWQRRRMLPLSAHDEVFVRR